MRLQDLKPLIAEKLVYNIKSLCSNIPNFPYHIHYKVSKDSFTIYLSLSRSEANEWDNWRIICDEDVVSILYCIGLEILNEKIMLKVRVRSSKSWPGEREEVEKRQEDYYYTPRIQHFRRENEFIVEAKAEALLILLEAFIDTEKSVKQIMES